MAPLLPRRRNELHGILCRTANAILRVQRPAHRRGLPPPGRDIEELFTLPGEVILPKPVIAGGVVFPSAGKASEAFGLNRTAVSVAIYRSLRAGGHYWRFVTAREIFQAQRGVTMEERPA